ncbi:enoyl-CoA hydratase/isomerase family protein [Sedimentitalea sp. JM2-8]|uniref:Enoyl-CoA hydratase/isomerase family protein n=1 Tax=Sedimentitalea xiamensis TaxID=3050037 RepID=A0ABT7F909_9RHOB|nr:enoyl-CoA hydratase/isomerase family protein [Sedimentitalea xiamensis]MDK3071590.1 enoyl-CoA hydratase/isomerase family protein [Sedimentitalea xiamensis]
MIDLARNEGLWTVTINRPDKANSLTAAMLDDLVSIAEEATEARALILTGAGKVFSAGADLDEARAGLATSPVWERLSGAIACLPCLTVAALNGTLAGGAMGMALACDLRLAVPSAKFFYPVMKLGFMPQPSDPARMVALIGPARTKLILMGGQKVMAEEAFRFGLVDRIVPPENLMETALELTLDSQAAAPDVARGIAALCGKPLG